MKSILEISSQQRQSSGEIFLSSNLELIHVAQQIDSAVDISVNEILAMYELNSRNQ